MNISVQRRQGTVQNIKPVAWCKPFDGTQLGVYFGWCPMLKNLLLYRSDIAQTFDTTTEGGLVDAIAWMFARAVPEYGLFEHIDSITLQALNAPVGNFPPPHKPCEHAAPGVPDLDLSVLMALLWRHRVDVHAHFDISTALGRIKYVLWFISNGVHEMKLQPLITTAWRTWLLEEVPYLQSQHLPRLGLLAWSVRPNVQSAFDLKMQAGVSGLAAWVQRAVQTDPKWQWLKLPADADKHQHRWQQPPMKDFGVNLIGFARGELGIGEDIRMAVAACQAAGIAFSVVHISTGQNTRQCDIFLDDYLQAISNAPYRINIFCLTAFDTLRIYFDQGLFSQRYNIGWWPWELPIWPKDWDIAFDVVDEIWAATQFTKQVFTSAQYPVPTPHFTPAIAQPPTRSPVPTHWMPLAASVDRAVPTSRSALGLPVAPFLFLYVFDFNSSLARKHPFAAIDAFQKAFIALDKSVCLVLKTMNSNPNAPEWQRLMDACGQDDRICLLNKTLDRGEVLGLIQTCDAYVSLHRSEGFGRTLAEAMLFGKPVVATNFSGSTDFLNPDNGFPVRWHRRAVEPGEYPYITPQDAAWWAEPDLEHAASQMHAARRAGSDKGFAERVKQFAATQFSVGRIGEMMLERLKEIDRYIF